MKNTALTVSGLVFLFIAVMHGIRYYQGWDILISHHLISLNVSIYGGVVSLLLAIWMFVAASK